MLVIYAYIYLKLVEENCKVPVLNFPLLQPSWCIARVVWMCWVLGELFEYAICCRRVLGCYPLPGCIEEELGGT